MSKSSALTFASETRGACPRCAVAENESRPASAAKANIFLKDLMSVVLCRADLYFFDFNFLKQTKVEPVCVFKMKRDAGGLCWRG